MNNYIYLQYILTLYFLMYFITLFYYFSEDVKLWMRGTHEFTKIQPPRNLMISQYTFLVVCRVQNLRNHLYTCITNATRMKT